MLKYLGLVGLAIALVLFAIYIRVHMEIANYIGNIFRKFIKYLISLLQNRKINNWAYQLFLCVHWKFERVLLFW